MILRAGRSSTAAGGGGFVLVLELPLRQHVPDTAVDVYPRAVMPALHALALGFALGAGLVGAVAIRISTRGWWAQYGGEDGGVGEDLAAVDEAEAAVAVGVREAGADQGLECCDGGLMRGEDVEVQVRQRGAEADGEVEGGAGREGGWAGGRGRPGLGRRHR